MPTIQQPPTEVRPVIDPDGNPTVCIKIGTDWFAFSIYQARLFAEGIKVAADNAEATAKQRQGGSNE